MAVQDRSQQTLTLRRAERRRWPDASKVKIVAESYAPGVVVTELARRHGALASQVHAWRKAVREGRLVAPAGDGAMFARVIVAAAPDPKPRTPPLTTSGPIIEIDGDGVQVRVRTGADPELVGAIIRALKTTS